MGEGYEAGRARELGRRGKEKGRQGKRKFVQICTPPGPHLRKRSDAPVLPQYDSRMIRFHTLKYVRMIPKNVIRMIGIPELWAKPLRPRL